MSFTRVFLFIIVDKDSGLKKRSFVLSLSFDFLKDVTLSTTFIH